MKRIEKIHIGEKLEYYIKITEEMHTDFMRISGDNSPIHIDKDVAISNNSTSKSL